MTERATGRHRATHKSSTPLSTLTGSLSVVGDCVGAVRRSGVIIAMSSGLVASMALPAHAVNGQPEAAGPVTASIPVIPANGAGAALFAAPSGGLLALPLDLVADTGTVTAPAAAMVDFDHSSFTLEQPGQPPADAGDQVDAGSQQAATKAAPPKRKQLRLQDATQSTVLKPAGPKSTASKSESKQSADTTSKSETSTPASTLGAKAVQIAFRYQGTPYLWGGSTPRGFDCSGFTRYVYAQLGKQLSRTVAAQRGDVRFVSRSQAKPGDLVFMGSGHVGLYLGNNRMIDSPRRGKTIQPREIYTSNVQFGRVI